VPQHWRTKYENADLNLESIPELTGYFTSQTRTQTRIQKIIKRKINPKEVERETIKCQIKILPSTAPFTNLLHMIPVNARLRRAMTLKPIIKIIKKQLSLHLYQIISAMSQGNFKKGSSNFGYDEFFISDNNYHFDSPPLDEEACVMEAQNVNTPTQKTNDSKLITPNLQANNEMTTEVLITFTSKEIGKQQVVNCLIDTGCSRGLICETLVSPEEQVNKQVMNWRTKKGNFTTLGSAKKTYLIPAFTTHHEVTSTFEIMPATMSEDSYNGKGCHKQSWIDH
jgi:hypothetical protein